ncbi:hypothetical protein LPUS_02957 [Lasallia pustulata]|uniref:Uncharacterized protein n=1 Tax=Lasallia pustulata TaxID=136370 RepID=A0A1W5CTV5_9LECA|nr:hypothetical protein LPUS_02957 [Lasallia pustulata]
MTPSHKWVSSVNSVRLNEDLGEFGGRASQTFLSRPNYNAKRSGLSLNGEVFYASFLYLAIPTVTAIAILIADARQVAFTGGIYVVVTGNRASVSIAVQVISIGLALIQVAAVSRTFNFATRIRLRKVPTSLSVLQFWNGISSGNIQWSLKSKLLALLSIYVGLAAIPAAIWTGSLTPVVTSTTHATTVRIPQYSNMSLVKEWPLEIARSGPSLRNAKGFFTYSIGGQYGGLLTQSITTATTMDGSPRHHVKYDNSNFMYIGRSFGVGSSVGLVDDDIVQNPLAQSYQYQETGYATQVTCSYNTSDTFFHISQLEVDVMLYPAEGYLPDSTGPEFSVFVGHGADAIVAFGVAAQPVKMGSTRYLGIAAGSSYVNLDATQCKLDFIPSAFDVVVNVKSKSITPDRRVVTTDDEIMPSSATDIEPSGNLIHVVARQIELYSNDLTNIYQSIVGNALNFSISDYRTFVEQSSANNSNTPSPDSTTITLKGIENSITAMIDDILVGYASAQLMIADDLVETSATVSLSAIGFGKSIYIYINFAISTLVLLLVAEEAIRTKGWRDLPAFDYTDLAHLAIASSKGGTDIADVTTSGVSQAGEDRSEDEKETDRHRGLSYSWSLARLQRLISNRDQSYTRVRILLREEEGREDGGSGLDRFSLGVA